MKPQTLTRVLMSRASTGLSLSTLSLMRSWEYPAKDNSGGSWQADDLKKTMGPRKRGHMNETDSSSSQIAEGEMNQ